MKKLIIVIAILSAINVFASMPKVIYFGMLDRSGNEFTNENIDGVTYRAWLNQGTGPSIGGFTLITQADSLAQCGVAMYPDPVEYPLRGVSMVDLQHFPAWGVGNILHIEMIDWNDGSGGHCSALADYVIEGDEPFVELGFEDLGIEGSGMPYMLTWESGSDTKTFIYPCVTTTGTDLNFVGLPVQNGWTNASDFDPTHTNIDAVSKFDPVAQGWETAGYYPGLGWLTDFSVQTGGAYLINAKNNFDFIVEGDSIAVQYNLITTAGTDNNPICVPLSKAGLTDTELLGNDIAVCNAISKYNNSTQQFSTSAESVFGWANIFDVEPGMALLASVTEAAVWPSSKVITDNTDTVSGQIHPNKGLTGGGPRVIYYHLVDVDGSELDFSTEPYANIEFKVWNNDNPAEILDKDSPGCGFTMLGGIYSVFYFNPGNFVYSWESGDEIQIIVEDKSRPYMIPDTYWGDMRTFLLDNSSSPVVSGFESLAPGTGNPMQIMMPSTIETNSLPSYISLSQNYPNPFNPETEISFSLPKEEQVTLSVFNSEGQFVKELVNGTVSVGKHEVYFNAENLNSGIYFYTLETGSTKLSKKMLLIK